MEHEIHYYVNKFQLKLRIKKDTFTIKSYSKFMKITKKFRNFLQ